MEENITVKIWIGGGRWTNHSRLRARHIYDENTKNIFCKKEYSDTLDSYLGELKNVTCEVCKRRFLKTQRK